MKLFKQRKSDPVAVVFCNSYEQKTVFAAVQKAIDAIGYTIPHGMRVLIKPNIIAQNTPDQATTTHPAIIDALCRIFTTAKCSISIGDASAFYQRGGTLKGMKTAGISAVALKYNAQMLPFENTALHCITTGKILQSFWVTKAVFEHDLIVNVPKLKIHQLARYSGAIKNMYGCIPGGTKQLYHEMYQDRSDYKEFWGEAIVDVYESVRPGLTIMDAVYGLDKNGPAANGKPRLTGVILGSVNGAQLDVTACRMIGFKPQWVPAVRVALERGLADENNVYIIGTVPYVSYVKLKDAPPSKISDYFFHQMIMKPVVSQIRCKKECMVCEKICAPGAILFDIKKRPVINYDTCIRCYCCAEQCPYGAIRLHGSFFNHIIQLSRRLLKL